MSSIFSTQNLQTFLRRKNLRPRRLRAEDRRDRVRRHRRQIADDLHRDDLRSDAAFRSVPIALVLSFRQPYFSSEFSGQ